MDDHTEAERVKNEHIARHHGEYWLDNRSAILDAIEQGGFVLMSNATGFWLAARATQASAPATGGKPSPVDATASLIDAARAVVDRWHTPRPWKEVEHTAAFIARLDEAATRRQGQGRAPVSWTQRTLSATRVGLRAKDA
jgi:hypothetical protein